MTTLPRADVLIFCPGLGGHRQTYAYVLAKCLLECGLRIALALGRGGGGEPACEMGLLKELAHHPRVWFHDLHEPVAQAGETGHWVRAVCLLERELGVGWTIFPTGDEVRTSLDGLGSVERPAGLRRAAVFICLTHIYPRDFRQVPLWRRPRARASAFRDSFRARAYFKKVVWKRLGLDLILVSDPGFHASPRSGRFAYLPDMFRAWGAVSGDFEAERLELRRFLTRQPNKMPLIYFGTWQARRGPDDLLALARDHPDTVFASCGRKAPGQYLWDVSKLQQELEGQGRFLHIELPYSPYSRLVDEIFLAPPFVVLPYRDFYGLSGILLDAASYGKPVLVPDVGYMGSVVKKRQLGTCYRHKDYEDLCRKFRAMRQDFQRYQDSATQFGTGFSLEKVRLALTQALFGINGAASEHHPSGRCAP